MRNLGAGGDALSILMLEDNPLDVELVEARLRSAGYEYQAWKATCRAEFENAFAGRNYDVILADFSLPDFDGSTALDIVRAKDKFVPFIFVSGALGEDVAVDSLHRGATDYVLKQRLDRLIPAVSRALNEYSERLSRIEAEELLRESELRFQQVTNVLPALVWIADASGKLLYRNKSWSDFFGSSDHESWCDLSLLHIDDVSQVTRRVARCIADRFVCRAGMPLSPRRRFSLPLAPRPNRSTPLQHFERNLGWHLHRSASAERTRRAPPHLRKDGGHRAHGRRHRTRNQ